jgi:hypothetical protein
VVTPPLNTIVGIYQSSFNPSVGILGGHTWARPYIDWAIGGVRVSIPQSGFLVVTLIRIGMIAAGDVGFNPSVGILGGHTRLKLRCF